jgi:hypothetical protein
MPRRMAWWDIGQYVRDVTRATYVPEIVSVVGFAAYRRLMRLGIGYVLLAFYNWFRRDPVARPGRTCRVR